MSDITVEIESLRDYVIDPKYSRIWMQSLPDKFTASELAIRFVGDESTSETGYHYRMDRDYQFIYFGKSERECITVASGLQRRINNTDVIKLKGSDRYMRIGQLSVSQPFKTEDGNVFAVIGILPAVVRQAREYEQYPKMSEIDITKQE